MSRYPAQAELWGWRTAGKLVLHDLNEGEMIRMAALMADASLVAAAERLGMHRVFTLDSDFHIYRLADGSALECIA